MVFFGIKELGTISNFLDSLHNISPNYMNWFPSSNFSDYFFAPFLFIMGWIFFWNNVYLQPHVMIRFMAINNTNNIPQTRIYYYGWYISFYTLTICAAFVARLSKLETNNLD